MLEIEREKWSKLTGVEEHVAHSSGLTMDLEGMSAQDNPLGNDTSGIGIFKGAHGYQFWSLKRYSI